MSESTLRYPSEIAKEIGLSSAEINAMKGKGCPFYGRKTSVRWVNLYLDQIAGAEQLIYRSEFPQCPLAKLLDPPSRSAPSKR